MKFLKTINYWMKSNMWATLFFLVLLTLIYICFGMLKTGGAAFPRIESLEHEIEQAKIRDDIHFYADRYEGWLNEIK